jgi:hypothetical protein
VQDSWEEDGYLFTKEGRNIWVRSSPSLAYLLGDSLP